MNNQYYSPSVNIIRDQHESLNYIVTANARHIAESIASHFETVNHCFNIIGSYGTGKSSFIWALEQNLKGNKDYFYSNQENFNSKEKFHFLKLIGSHQSIVQSLGEQIGFKGDHPQALLEAFDRYYTELEKKNEFLFIVFDEYGKFLEYAAKNNSEESIYFLQQLAEYVNGKDKNIILLTTLHQNFTQYGSGLSTKEKNEWVKVSGRFVDLTFNEPVDQLLYLAGERIQQWGFENKDIENLNKVNDTILQSKVIKNSDHYYADFGNKLFPFDIAAVVCLTQALQNYGQNERSLFTFLNRREKKSLYRFAEKGKHYDLNHVHDFLIQNFAGFIVSSSNPDKNKWDAIRTALDSVEALIEKNQKLAEKVVKTIGLLSVFSNIAGKIDEELICTYFFEESQKKIKAVLAELEQKKIVRFRKYTSRYILFEGTDLDFEQALLGAGQKLSRNKDLANNIKRFYDLPCVLAKAVSYQIGTPRFFAYEISNEPLKRRAVGELDGYINLVFSQENEIEHKVAECSSNYSTNLYAFFTRTEEVSDLLFELEKVEYVKQVNQDDRVAIKELDYMRSILEEKLSQEILSNLTTESVNWYRNGERIQIRSHRQLNKELSQLCREEYELTPVLKNELMNKHKLSGSIASARRNYMRALIKHSGKEDLGFPKDKYPAEKTIFLSLLKESQIYQHVAEDAWEFSIPDETSIFYNLWYKSLEILNRAKEERMSIQVFFDELSAAPYKMKEGFLSFWIPTFLHIQQNNFALFNVKGYLPVLTEEVFELLHKSPKNYWFKTFAVGDLNLDLLNTYRALMNKKLETTGNRSIYLETIRPLLLFYRELPKYTQQTKSVSPEALQFREAIANAKDPESAFFVDIPNALGYSGLDLKNKSIDLNNYLEQLRNVIKELRNCEQDLLKDIEEKIVEIIGVRGDSKYISYKGQLENRFAEIDGEIIATHLKRFLGRIIVPIQSKNDWIKGLFNSLFAKSFADIRDEEIPIFIKKFKKAFKDLERLVDLHRLNNTREVESVCAVDIIDRSGNVKKEQIIFPEQVSAAYEKSENEIDRLIEGLKKDEKKALLLKKLQELI
jgi:hypothetical protein